MNKENQKSVYIQFPTALLAVLSDMGIRIILYVINQNNLMKSQSKEPWKIYPKTIELEYSKFKGYSHNRVQTTFRELRNLGLIILSPDNHYYSLNKSELDQWYGYKITEADQNQVTLGPPGSGELVKNRSTKEYNPDNIVHTGSSTSEKRIPVYTGDKDMKRKAEDNNMKLFLAACKSLPTGQGPLRNDALNDLCKEYNINENVLKEIGVI